MKATEPKSSSSKKPEVFKVSWSPQAALIVTVAIFFLSQIIGGIAVSIYPLIRNWDRAQANHWLSTSVLAQAVAVLAIDVAVILLLRAFLKRRHTGFGALGLRKPKIRDIGYALAGFVTYFLLFGIIVALAQAFLPLDFEQRQELGFSLSTSGISLLPVFISLVLLPPIVEEILMRGFLYTGLRPGIGKIPAALLTSVLFAAAHLQWGSGNALLWLAAIDTFTLALVLVYLREKTNSLASPIMLHMIKNGLVFVNLFILHNG